MIHAGYPVIKRTQPARYTIHNGPYNKKKVSAWHLTKSCGASPASYQISGNSNA